MHFSSESSERVLAFLKHNVLISLAQEHELREKAKAQKISELDVMIKLFPENADKIAEILQMEYQTLTTKYVRKKDDTIFRIKDFYLVKRKNEGLIITHDPQLVVDYFNYITPTTYVVPHAQIEEFSHDSKVTEASPADIEQYFIQSDDILIDSVTEKKSKNVTDANADEDAVKQLDKIIQESSKNGSSDIHVEVDSDVDGIPFYLVRYRVDGVLKEFLRSNNMDVYAGILSQIKLRAGLKLDETRLPQDGRMNYSLFGNISSFRVSTKPVIINDIKSSGDSQKEKIVIRRMPDISNLNLEKLGYNPLNIKIIREASSLAHGFNIITGPTGSGKTTLLYAILQELDRDRLNISTIEDPVEAEIKKINQTQALPEIGLDFKRVLRAELRQDPDIIMVGEMRDRETAEIAAEASLTGHLVFSTLHTKNAVSSITRLINMGVPAYIVSSALSYSAAQRLIRRLCPDCKIKTADTKPVIKKYMTPLMKNMPNKELKDFFNDRIKNMNICEASKEGCQKCNHMGYTGRTAILEIFKITDSAEEIILKHNANEIMLQADSEKQGMLTMEIDGLIKVLEGTSSIEELYRALIHD
ncbi:pilus assembly protein TapB [Candidatus Peregrinibacteria bacterium]|nr:MAG: pilus assembly protein TapB [Candidatus Peregrinibacteria bacterium]